VDLMAREWFIRRSVFAHLDRAVELHGDVIPSRVLRAGVEIDGQRLLLMGPQGIFKPASLSYPLSITTAPIVDGRDRPYEDEVSDDGLLLYRYRGTDPRHHDNIGLRDTMQLQLPLGRQERSRVTTRLPPARVDVVTPGLAPGAGFVLRRTV
jgi:putative restriction endonuclease